MNQFQYGSWNPRGTSNSEYGKFVYSNGFIGPAQSGRGHFGGGGEAGGWGNNYQGHQNENPYKQHQPGCHNHPQNVGTYHQHQSDCPNAKTDGRGEDSQPFDVYVGEEAATAALGGKEQFQAHFPTQQPQMEDQNGGNSSQNAQIPTMDEIPEAMQTTSEAGGGDQPGNSSPVMMESPKQKIPPKWKGLPPTIQYGRHIRPGLNPRPSSTSLNSMAQNECMTPGPFKKRTPTLATSKYLNNTKPTSSSTTMLPSSLTRMRAPPTPAEARLCGKCPKCKDFLPPVDGPLIMTFPSSATASLNKPNLRQMHTMGRQDAKNFKAVRYNHHIRGGMNDD